MFAARISTQADAKAVGEAVSAQTAREAGLSGFVCPFAFRLGCVDNKTPDSSNGDRVDEEGGAAREARGSINDDDEGYCDNGDVGAGEKLLCLLQKWDVRRRVLVVTRIDGGFVLAELLGVRRCGSQTCLIACASCGALLTSKIRGIVTCTPQ